MKAIRTQDKRLFSNTMFLYLMTFSTQLFSFITVPYLTRVLGPAIYGKTGVAQAYMTYVQIILDFGFILSATQKVVKAREDQVELGRLITAVTLAKMGLSLLTAAAFSAFVLTNETMQADFPFYVLFFAATAVNAMMPDFYYRGIEQMRAITLRTFAVKGLCAALTFLLIKNPEDYRLIPLFQLMGNGLAVGLMYADIIHGHHVSLRKVDGRYLVRTVGDALPFFVSRAASTAYQGLNAIILGFLYGTTPAVGYYTSADKIVSLSKSASSPVADSLYPYMIKEKNYRLIRKLFLFSIPVILTGVLVAFLFAEPLCLWLFGSDYAGTGKVLRCLLPIVAVILPSYILCFPVMVPMGLSKWANFSNVIGLCTQIAGLIVLSLLGKMNIYALCLLTSFSEVSVFCFRLGVVLRRLRADKSVDRRTTKE